MREGKRREKGRLKQAEKGRGDSNRGRVGKDGAKRKEGREGEKVEEETRGKTGGE